jgi:hypothetical protein
MKCDKTYSKNMHLLNYMFKEQTGKKGTILQHIKPAPPRETLELLGGPLTIEEFRKNSSVVIVNRIPFIYKPSQMQKFTKIVKPEEKIFKILPPCKKYKPVKQIFFLEEHLAPPPPKTAGGGTGALRGGGMANPPPRLPSHTATEHVSIHVDICT